MSEVLRHDTTVISLTSKQQLPPIQCRLLLYSETYLFLPVNDWKRRHIVYLQRTTKVAMRLEKTPYCLFVKNNKSCNAISHVTLHGLYSLHLFERNYLNLQGLYHICEGESISNQPIPFPMDRDGHNFHALFQYLFYTWVQNCTRIESSFNKILNVKHG